MRVVHVGLETTLTRPGGLNRYLRSLLSAQRADGLDARAVVLGVDPPDAQRDAGLVVAGPCSGSMLARAMRVDRAVRRMERPDVADLHFAGTAVVAATVGSLRRVPTVVHFQGPWADESASVGKGSANVMTKRSIERAVYRRADRFIVLSGAFATLLRERYGVAPWAIDVVAPGVDLERFTPGDRASARAALGVGEQRVVLAVRRLVPRMGLDVLLRAWQALDIAGAATLVVVGDGPSASELCAHAAELSVTSSVRFCGTVDDATLVQWYRAADLTVVPSVALEGYGLVVLESLACGTPVVGTDADGLRDAIEQLGQGPAVPAGDAGALAAAVRSALDAPSDDSVRSSCRAIAERHGWTAVAMRHREIYDTVLSGAEQLRVVLLDHTAVLSGGELAIARALEGVRATASVHAILAADGPLRSRLEGAGATVEILGLHESARTMAREQVGARRIDARAAIASVSYVVRLARRLRALQPDVVHTNSLKSALYGGAAARLAGVPCVWHVRDRIEEPYLPARAVRLVHRAARMLPSIVIANSASTLRTVDVVGGMVVPSPLDPSISPSTDRAAYAGPVRFAVVGRLSPWKGQDLAIEAFAEAFPTGAETLQIVGAPMFGEDDFASGLDSLVERHGLGGRVEFRGFVDDIASVLARTDVLVHTSVLPEPFGQVIVEAMGSGCAVLVADKGGPVDTVTDGVDGILYAMGDRAALATAMRRLAGDRALRARLGGAAVRTAGTFTPAALAPALLEAWRAAAATRPRRRGRHRG